MSHDVKQCRYGDITPSTRSELCVAILGMSVGIFLYGWLTAVLTAFLLHEDPHDAMVNSKMSQLTFYLNKHEYPRDMKRQIVSYFRHYYANTSSFDDVQMLQQLPYTLYESAAHFLVEKLIKNFVVFTGIEKDIVALILKVLKPMTSSDEIVKRGQPAGMVCFLTSSPPPTHFFNLYILKYFYRRYHVSY